MSESNPRYIKRDRQDSSDAFTHWYARQMLLFMLCDAHSYISQAPASHLPEAASRLSITRFKSRPEMRCLESLRALTPRP